MKKYLFLLLILGSFIACDKPVMDYQCKEVTVVEVSKQFPNPIINTVLNDTATQLLIRDRGYSYKDRYDLCTPDGSAYIVILGTPANTASQAFLMIRYLGNSVYTTSLVERYETINSPNVRVVSTIPGGSVTDVVFDTTPQGKEVPCNKKTTSFGECMSCSFEVLTNDLPGMLSFAFLPHVMTAAMLIHCA